MIIVPGAAVDDHSGNGPNGDFAMADEPLDIHDVAPLLYGRAWQQSMSADLNINHRTVERWATGARDPGPNAWEAIGELIRQRQVDLAAMLKRVEAEVARLERRRDE